MNTHTILGDPVSPEVTEPARPPALWLWLVQGEDGPRIRKWSDKPFAEGEVYMQAARFNELLGQLGENAAEAAKEYAASIAEHRARIEELEEENERLRGAATRAAAIIKRNLYRQSEKVEDASRILSAALSPDNANSEVKP